MARTKENGNLTEQLIVVKKVRKYLASQEIRTSVDFPIALSKYVAETLDKVIKRCKANKRGTASPEHL